MTILRAKSRALLLAAICAAPLAVAACGSGNADPGTATSAAPVAKVAAPQGRPWTQTVSRTQDGGWLVGNPQAPIKLVEYGSLTCPACAAFSQDASATLENTYIDSGRVNYEFRPIMIHGMIDLVLTRMLECVPNEAAIPIADQLWANNSQIITTAQKNQAQLNRAMTLPENQRFVTFADDSGLTDFFAQRGVSRDKVRQCLSDPAAVKKLAEDTNAMATRHEINHTPTFDLNGNRLDENSWAQVEPMLQRAGAR